MAPPAPTRAPSRLHRRLLFVVGLLVTAQVSAVATAGTSGVRLDQPPPAPAVVAMAAPATPGTTVPTGRPLVSVELDPFTVEVGLGPLGPQPTVDTKGLRCGSGDRPETGLQGDVPLTDQLSGRASEGYNCGLEVIGYNSLGDRGGNSNLAWAGDCAFVAGDGIAVVDVSDPTRPRHTTTLRTPGSSQTIETLAAGKVGDRALLAAGRYGLFFDFSLTGSAPVDLFDVSDCANPRLLSSTLIAPGVHNLTFSPDLQTLWSSLPTQAIDVSDPTAPTLIANVDDELRALGLTRLEISHEASISPDGTRLYLGGQVPGDEGTTIVDIEGYPTRPLRIVSNFSGPGHSLSHATIGGRKYLVRSDESVVPPTGTPCLPTDLTPFGGVAQAFLTDIGDETAPVDRGTLSLEIGDSANCAASLLSGVNPSAHYQNVDDPTDTTFVMVSMWNSGLRLYDVRDPDRPREVAYFNPGQFPIAPLSFAGGSLDRVFGLGRTSLDIAWGHVRYDQRTGVIWMATRTGGFWVLQLEEQVRDQLGLPDVATRAALEGSPRPIASRDVRPAGLLPNSAPAGLYCTIAPLNAL